MLNSYDPTTTIEGLDEAYNVLMDAARTLRDAFFIEAKAQLDGSLTHVPIVISIRKNPGNSTSINWSRMLVSKGASKGAAKPFPRVIPRKAGKGNRVYHYPVDQFRFLTPNLRRLVLGYEAKLAAIREHSSALLEERRRILALAARIDNVLEQCEDIKNRVTL